MYQNKIADVQFDSMIVIKSLNLIRNGKFNSLINILTVIYLFQILICELPYEYDLHSYAGVHQIYVVGGATVLRIQCGHLCFCHPNELLEEQ